MNKKIINGNDIFIRMLSKMRVYIRVYCSMSHNFSTFNTAHDALFLVFGVPNSKYLAFGTPDENTLTNNYHKL